MAKQKKDGEEVGLAVGILALAALAIWASNKAYKSAKQTDVPLIIEEDNNLYKHYPDGTKVFIKKLPHYERNLPPNFILR